MELIIYKFKIHFTSTGRRKNLRTYVNVLVPVCETNSMTLLIVGWSNYVIYHPRFFT